MKDQQLDKLFRDKLANYQKAVPSSAWNRIESAVERKAFPAFRVAVAASVASSFIDGGKVVQESEGVG